MRVLVTSNLETVIIPTPSGETKIIAHRTTVCPESKMLSGQIDEVKPLAI